MASVLLTTHWTGIIGEGQFTVRIFALRLLRSLLISSTSCSLHHMIKSALQSWRWEHQMKT